MISLSVDPGIRGTGYALWDGKLLKRTGIFASRSEDWLEAGGQVASQLHQFACKERVEAVYCEFPAYFQSAGAQVVARSGSLVKLAWFVGFLSALFITGFKTFRFVEVNEWKGQLPKDVVELRIRKIMGEKVTKKFKTHIWDAVGIGLYVHGRMK